MAKKFQFITDRFVIIPLLILTIVSGLFGCMPPPLTQEIILPFPICTPESPLVNVYRVTPQPWANLIFDFAFSTTSPPIPPATPAPLPPLNEQQILMARYAALGQLTKETIRWSDTNTINLNNSSQIRITITYLSPELLQAVFLNQTLKDRFPITGFQDQIQNALNSVAKRDELLFLLTVTKTDNSLNPTRYTIRIPAQEMVMRNAENITIFRSHEDYNLEQVIDSSSDPVFGYLGYPLSQVTAEQCKWVLDPTYNTNIVITVPFLEVDGIENNTPYFWTIPYAPLIPPIVSANTTNFNMPADFDTNLMTPLAVPPSDLNQSNYWQDFSRFIWGQVTLEKY